MIPRSLPLVAAVLAIVFSNSARCQDFQTIAHWQFEQGANFLNDSSGNEHHFTVPAIASITAPEFSSDKPDMSMVAGSASFVGNTFAQTVIPLQLSSFQWVRISYWMKVEGTANDQVLLENSFDTNFQVNVGSTMHVINPSGLPDASALTAFRTGPGFPSAATPLDLALFDTLDQWHFVQVDYNFAEIVPADRIKLFINEVEGETFRDTGVPQWSTLRNDTLYVGGRREFSGDPSLFFTGKIADVKIEAVAPPGAPGDFNGDGMVDGTDFLLWQRGESPNPLTSGDLQDWRTNFGTSGSPSLLAMTAVPEPNALAATSLAAIIAAICRAGSRRNSFPWRREF